MNDQFTVYCRCGCGAGLHADFKFAKDDGDVYIQTVIPGFYAHQSSWWGRLKRRIVTAWYMLMDKEYITHEIVLDAQNWEAFVLAVNEMDIEYAHRKGVNA